MTTDTSVLSDAKRIAKDASTWADLSNELFDPQHGLLAKLYPDPVLRKEFMNSTEYAAIKRLVADKMTQTGIAQGGQPEKSGKFLVRVPKSLHAALETEATREGVSLNQLVVAKLGAQLSRLASGPKPEMARIAQAYLEVREGFSIDRVVLDPCMNREFLKRCRELGLSGCDFDLNWRLLQGRKSNAFSALPETRNYTASRKDEFEFASEIGVRVVQERVKSEAGKLISLDRIMCDPELAHEFDLVAASLAPGFKPVEYRWVAMGLRKAAGRYRSKAAAVSSPKFEYIGSVKKIRSARISPLPGVYILRTEDSALFIGETENLQHRIERHLEGSNSNGIPEWLFSSRAKAIELGVYPMPGIGSGTRKISELSAVNALAPRFNYVSRKAA